MTDGARATFIFYGEIFRLCDTACDGNPVYLEYWFKGIERRLDHSGGCGTHATWNLDLPENKRITCQACVNIRSCFYRCFYWVSFSMAL